MGQGCQSLVLTCFLLDQSEVKRRIFMLGKVEEKMEEKAMVQFLSKFDDYPFLEKFKDAEYPIGTGTPTLL